MSLPFSVTVALVSSSPWIFIDHKDLFTSNSYQSRWRLISCGSCLKKKVKKGSRMTWNTRESSIFWWPARSSILCQWNKRSETSGQGELKLRTGPLRPFPLPPERGPWGHPDGLPQVPAGQRWYKDHGTYLPQAGSLWTWVRPTPVLLPYLAHPVNTHRASSTGCTISRAGSGDVATSNQTATNG